MASIQETEKKMQNLSLKTEKKPDEKNSYQQAGLMRPSDLKIGKPDMDGNIINTNGELKKARAKLQEAQKAMKAGGAPPKKPQQQQQTKTQQEPKKTVLVKPELELTKTASPILSPQPLEKSSSIMNIHPSCILSPNSSYAMSKAQKAQQFFKMNQNRVIPRVLPQNHKVGCDEYSIPQKLPLSQFNIGTYVDESAPTVVLPESFKQLGVQYGLNGIIGTTYRVLAYIDALKEYVYTITDDMTFSTVNAQLRHSHKYLECCRHKCHALSRVMNTALDMVKITYNNNQKSDSCIKAQLLNVINDWEKSIELGQCKITEYGVDRIVDGDVILTYARSDVVEKIFLSAHEEGKQFRVVVVDSRPLLEGKVLLDNLVSAGIDCDYTYIASINYIMKNVTKVFVGAHAMLANGSVLSRIGTAVVAMVAKFDRKPLLVCAETFKFADKTQVDSLSHNDFGHPQEFFNCETPLPLQSTTGGVNAKASEILTETKYNEMGCYNVLNPHYDLTPYTQISAMVTEFGILPASSACVIIREAGNHKKNLTQNYDEEE